jgi:hypothetical protein
LVAVPTAEVRAREIRIDLRAIALLVMCVDRAAVLRNDPAGS